MVELLNTGQVSLGTLSNGETALHAAALFGHKNVVMALVTAGAQPNSLNRVIHPCYAIIVCFLIVIPLLCPQDGSSPIDLASQAGYEQIVTYLLSLLSSMQQQPTWVQENDSTTRDVFEGPTEQTKASESKQDTLVPAAMNAYENTPSPNSISTVV